MTGHGAFYDLGISTERYYAVLMMLILPFGELIFLMGYLQRYRLIASELEDIRFVKWSKIGLWVLWIGTGLHIVNTSYTLATGWWHEGLMSWVMVVYWLITLPLCFLICFHYLSLIQHSIDKGQILKQIEDDGDGVSMGVIGTEIACLACGYNVKGLRFDASCPECGCENIRTMSDENFLFSSANWRGKICAGLWLIAALPFLLVAMNLFFYIVC